jgi:hypothetical protein
LPRGRFFQRRERRSMTDIYNLMGDSIFRCAFRILLSRIEDCHQYQVTPSLLCLQYRQHHIHSERQAGSLTNEELTEVITEIRQLWPECRMVRGSPRHSESNGGVERVNQTVQAKLKTWMRDTQSHK